MSLSPKTHPLAIAVQTPLLDQIRSVAKRMDMTQADVVRMAIKLGLASMARINYNIIDAVLSSEQPEVGAMKLAEETPAVKFQPARRKGK